MSVKPIGVLGGTFDPVHHGHLRVALDVLEELAFAEVRLLPSRQPPHRVTPGATPAQRLAMLAAAVARQPGLAIDQRELARAGPSYMHDTLASLRADLPDTPLCLLIGRDAFNELPTWHRWQELFQLAHFLVLERPGSIPAMPPALCAELNGRTITDPALLHQSCAGRVFAWQATQLDISATRIRALLAAGRSPRYLLPEVVLDYIKQYGLYTQSD
ncbi:MAG: nicotinate-nucleotide adenylyltransferase [Candidatus Competibacteraceae bacterium]|nr:nicotinate-nucleotide adenylyltransferase [Candidatus Competibacteraceae bacterium]MCB1806639.1 nicotinate-nucleotide adenylyltransferase [Candidatus Competibacteraceae bacterium]MCB1813329.1 nicotinate-nucleotide adenylyltransferase [Candidatus Competibacteraceae bacterium]